MNKVNILIVGAGELGSRHLQGILKSKNKLNVFCVDPSESSLDTARSRSQEVVHEHNLLFSQSYDPIPDHLFLVIVATSSNVRELVVTELFSRFTIENLVLEKVLFQDDQAFVNISDILKQYKDTKCWVNHPRRMFEYYRALKALIKPHEENNSTVFISGGGWGLACNSLHYIDMIEYLFNDKLSHIDTSEIKNLILESKRQNFIEMTGTLKGTLSNGVKFLIEERDAKIVAPVVIDIKLPERSILIQEGALPFYMVLDRNDCISRKDVVNIYQSELTTQIVDDLLEGNELRLPSFEHSMSAHRILIGSLLKKYNQITGGNYTKLPIT